MNIFLLFLSQNQVLKKGLNLNNFKKFKKKNVFFNTHMKNIICFFFLQLHVFTFFHVFCNRKLNLKLKYFVAFIIIITIIIFFGNFSKDICILKIYIEKPLKLKAKNLDPLI
jgi:hypothetical protein